MYTVHKPLVQSEQQNHPVRDILHGVFSKIYYFSKIVPFLKLEPLKAYFDRR